MSTESNPEAQPAPVSRRDHVLIALWAIIMLLWSGASGYWAIAHAYHNRVAAIARQKARVDPNALEEGKTAPEKNPPPGHEKDVPADVRIGLYVERVNELSVKETSWTVEFYLWFNWTSNDKDFDPGKSFQIVDGSIESRDLVKSSTKGDDHYALYRVVAKITKSFDVSRFPCDDHLLTINIEDEGLQSYQMRYVPDAENSSISSRVRFPGYQNYDLSAAVKPHSYKTRRGDPDVPANFRATYSQFVFGIWIERPDLGYFFKLFQGLYAAVAIALVAFFIKPTHVDPRFGLGIGAFFAAVANTYIVSNLLPDSGAMTLTDIINGIGMGIIFLTLVQSTISLYVYDTLGLEKTSRLFDRVSFFAIGLSYLAINIAIPFVAMRH